jgi:hypothetical protein
LCRYLAVLNGDYAFWQAACMFLVTLSDRLECTVRDNDQLSQERRAFLRKAGQAAVVAPAATLLLSVHSVQADDITGPYSCPPGTIPTPNGCQPPPG